MTGVQERRTNGVIKEEGKRKREGNKDGRSYGERMGASK